MNWLCRFSRTLIFSSKDSSWVKRMSYGALLLHFATLRRLQCGIQPGFNAGMSSRWISPSVFQCISSLWLLLRSRFSLTSHLPTSTCTSRLLRPLPFPLPPSLSLLFLVEPSVLSLPFLNFVAQGCKLFLTAWVATKLWNCPIFRRLRSRKDITPFQCCQIFSRKSHTNKENFWHSQPKIALISSKISCQNQKSFG